MDLRVVKSAERVVRTMGTATVVTILVVIIALVELISLLLFSPSGASRLSAAPKKVVFDSPAGATMKPAKSVVLWVRPDDSLESLAAGDIVTAALTRQGIKVTSYQQALATRYAAAASAAAAKAASKAPAKTTRSNLSGGNGGEGGSGAAMPDPLQNLDADYLVKVTLVPQSVQERLQGQNRRLDSEVRIGSRLSLITVSVFDRAATLVNVGSITYGEPVPLANGAFDAGEAVAQQMAGTTPKSP